MKSGSAIAPSASSAPRSTKRDCERRGEQRARRAQLDAVRCAEPEEAQRERDELRAGHAWPSRPPARRGSPAPTAAAKSGPSVAAVR